MCVGEEVCVCVCDDDAQRGEERFYHRGKDDDDENDDDATAKEMMKKKARETIEDASRNAKAWALAGLPPLPTTDEGEESAERAHATRKLRSGTIVVV